MKPVAKQIESKATRYIIGASILVLALMLFSELSCSLLGLCSKQFPLVAFFGFWEMLGISTALLFTSFSVRALRRKQHRYPTVANSLPQVNREDPIPDAIGTTETLSSHRRSSRWRDLFNQLSDEEKRKLKTIMEQHCISPSDQSNEKKSENAEEP